MPKVVATPTTRDTSQRMSTGSATDPVEPVAYIMSRFPTLSETFILREMLELEKQGQPVVVFPLIRMEPSVQHPEVDLIMPKVVFTPFFSLPIMSANVRCFLRSPGQYMKLLWSVLRGNWGSKNLFFGAIGIFPKCVYLAQVIEEKGIRHLHAHFATHPALAALIISELTGKTFSFAAHAHDFFVDIQMLCVKMQRANYIVTHAHFNKRYLLDLCPDTDPEKIKVVPDGVELERYQATGGGRRREVFTILCVASLSPYKGVEYLVKACDLLQPNLPEFKCILVGDGKERQRIEQLIDDLGLQAIVQVLGAQPQNKVAELLSEADVFIVPSIEAADGQMDTIPVASMEALASELPVVASRLSAIPELIEDQVTGLLVPPADEQALADAIIRLHEDPELCKELGRRGRERIVADYQLVPNVVKLRLLLQQVLAHGG